MPIRPGLNGQPDEHTALLQGGEEANGGGAGEGRPSYRAADEGTFQLSSHSEDKSKLINRNSDEVSSVCGSNKSNKLPWRNDIFATTAQGSSSSRSKKHRIEISEKLKEVIDISSAFTECKMKDEDLKRIKNKKLRGFYTEQNARISAWFEVDAGESGVLF